VSLEQTRAWCDFFAVGVSCGSGLEKESYLSKQILAACGVLLTAFVTPAIAQNPAQTQSGASAAPTAMQSEGPIAAKLREGMAAFQQRNYARALAIYREVAAAAPSNVFAYNMIGNCAQEMKDYPAAIAGFERALELQPDEWHNIAGLLRSYSLSGMTKERDLELDHVRELKRKGTLPADFSYIRDMFEIGEKRVLVSEFFPELGGRFHYRYWFNLYNAENQMLYRVALESDDADQWTWAKEHPKEAGEGQRKFSLDTYAQQSHGLIKFYDGEPDYAKVRADAEQVISGTAKAVVSSGPSGKSNSPTPPSSNASGNPK
jgi:tetratricopeptide (TPR) repeat protein